MHTLRLLFVLACVPSTIEAWTTQSASCSSRAPSALAATTSRQAFLQTSASALIGSILASSLPAAAEEVLPNGVKYTVKKTGTGPKPEIGELVAIRFAAYYGDTKIDDIYETPEPYYTRIGSGGLLKGVEQTLPMMQLGDRWVLTIPVSNCGCGDSTCLILLTSCFCTIGRARLW